MSGGKRAFARVLTAFARVLTAFGRALAAFPRVIAKTSGGKSRSYK